MKSRPGDLRIQITVLRLIRLLLVPSSSQGAAFLRAVRGVVLTHSDRSQQGDRH